MAIIKPMFRLWNMGAYLVEETALGLSLVVVKH